MNLQNSLPKITDPRSVLKHGVALVNGTKNCSAGSTANACKISACWRLHYIHIQ
uniref:Uncharacterized protein n=1 Tax=Solanum tuberosum TaxID=4113 RepID=M0ZKH5_SOLTU